MKYLFVSVLICLSLTGHAQQNHFIYIQADNKQPFYIRMDKKLISSSASGYLIISKLPEGSYDLSIGFPKNEWPEQKVTCSINNKDLGYLLKNFGEKGWGLFNFQTMDLVMADTKIKTDSSNIKVAKEDLFSTTLANVVNDPSLRAVEEEKVDTPAVAAPVKKPVVKKVPLVKSKPKDRISKLISRRNADSVKMVYADRVNGVTDTINIVIPVEKPVVKPAKLIAVNKKPAKKVPAVKPEIVKNETKIEDLAKDTIAAIITPVVKTEEPKIIIPADTVTVIAEQKKPDSIVNIIDSKPVVRSELTHPELVRESPKDAVTKTSDSVVKSVPIVVVKPVEPVKIPVKPIVTEKPKEEVIVRSATPAPAYVCKYVADGDEFMNLKKKMSKGKSDNEMLFIAHQLFLKRCVTSKQVERLSLLFTNDMAKYNLFDDAYHYTYDPENFPALQAQLTDDYYIKRFKAMLRQ